MRACRNHYYEGNHLHQIRKVLFRPALEILLKFDVELPTQAHHLHKTFNLASLGEIQQEYKCHTSLLARQYLSYASDKLH